MQGCWTIKLPALACLPQQPEQGDEIVNAMRQRGRR
jgi:hypothetical protein